MSSTESDPQQTKALIKFYQKHVLPLCKSGMADAQWTHVPDGPNTFYLTRKATRMTRADFELPVADEAQIARTLRAHWKGTSLETIPDPLLKLARQFEHTQRQAQVSAFVYEMF
jgi:hypothetical protein